jgi:starvation-inducible DNA-binding protein
MSDKHGDEVAAMLQKQLSRYNDLHLTLKHVHWNVIGPNFIAVHQMIDPQVALIRGYADEAAERIATLGGSPKGTPDAIINDRTWPDYPCDRDCADVHLAALERVYSGVIEDTRENIRRLQDLDVVTQDILIGHAGELEKVSVVPTGAPGNGRRLHQPTSPGGLEATAASQPGQVQRRARVVFRALRKEPDR